MCFKCYFLRYLEMAIKEEIEPIIIPNKTSTKIISKISRGEYWGIGIPWKKLKRGKITDSL